MRDTKNKLISLRIKRDMQEELQRLAQVKGTSASGLIRDWIQVALDEDKKPPWKGREAGGSGADTKGNG